MNWFFKPKYGLKSSKTNLKSGDLWFRCSSCKELVYKEDWKNHLKVCPYCSWHTRISARERIEILVDAGTFQEEDRDFESSDPLSFDGLDGSYRDKLKQTQDKTRLKEAILTGGAEIDRMKIQLCVMDFAFFGGSLSTVVGEKITRSVDRSIRQKIPLVIVTSSGGARMQEGLFSLMQMAKTCSMLQKLSEKGILYISILTDPTMGGVTASFAMVSDLVFAEPGALIGFAGPRVIEQTIKQKLPSHFQRSEFLLEKGFIDRILDRRHLKRELSKTLRFFLA